MRPIFILAGILTGLWVVNAAAEATSDYAKLNFETDCAPLGEMSEEGQGGTIVCPGLKGLSIVLGFGDLRESVEVHYKPSSTLETGWYSFSQWNSVNNVFEFRMQDGIPRATIHRVFIDNIDPNTGSADPKRQGQVLVITAISLQHGARSCRVGVVDALANKNANYVAREIADNIAPTFVCGQDQVKYYGNVGPYAGQF